MQPALKIRLIGAAVLVALAVIIVPLFFSGEPGGTGSQSISLDIPQTPDRALETRTMSVAPPPQAGPSRPMDGTGADARETASGDQLARVDIASRVPKDVGPGSAEPSNPDTPAATPAPREDATPAEPKPAEQPAADNRKATADKAAETKADKAKADQPARAEPGKAANARYQVSLGAYASKTNAEKLMKKVSKLGYPVRLTRVEIGGKPGARVDAGPFDSRAAGESARLKLHAALPSAPARLVSATSDQTRDAPAPKKADAKPRAGGWAVQLVAYSKKSDAEALRKKLRGGGFDSYVDNVKSGGNTLWRVRVGPQTQRADAVSLQSRIKRKFPDLSGRVVSVP